MLLFKKSSRKQEIEDYIASSQPHESQETKVYKALKKAGKWGLYNHELSSICLSWHRRIGDLRADGINIQCVKISKGVFKYYLND